MKSKSPSAIEVYEALPTDHARNLYLTKCVLHMDHQIFTSVLSDYSPKDNISLLTLYCQRHHRVTGAVFCVER